MEGSVRIPFEEKMKISMRNDDKSKEKMSESSHFFFLGGLLLDSIWRRRVKFERSEEKVNVWLCCILLMVKRWRRSNDWTKWVSGGRESVKNGGLLFSFSDGDCC